MSAEVARLVGEESDAPASVLAQAAELALHTGRRIVDPDAVEAACDLDHDTWFAAILALWKAGLLELSVPEPTQVALLAITNPGILHHVQTARPDLETVLDRLRTAAVRAEPNAAVPLAEWVGEPPLLVECLLDVWVAERQIVYSKAPGRRFRIHRVLFE
ncbi:MAG: hypothetical protein LC799_25155 [Actinobacteria bacterium]|nr:hypothetical protein [Actinomycetota bacterium]